MPLTSHADIGQLLTEARTVAVVGWSNKPDRPSYDVAQALQSYGYEVYLVNPTIKSLTNQVVYASLADIPVPIDIVDIFRRPEDVPEVVEAAIAVGAKAVWMQLGIVNEEAARRAEAAGLKVVMDRCMKVEGRRVFRQPVP